MTPRPTFMIRFQVLMAIIMSLVILVITAVTVELALQSGTRTARANAVRDFDRDATLVEERLGRLLDEFAGVAGMGAALPDGAAPIRGDGLNHPDQTFLRRMLADHSRLAAVRLARADGSLLEIIRTTAAASEGGSAVQPAPGTAYIVRTVTFSAGVWTDRRSGFDRDWRRLAAATPASVPSGAAAEDWFRQAMADDRIRIGTPRLVAGLQVPVISVSRAGAEKTFVFSADFSLDGLQDFMDAFRLTPNGLLVLFDQQGRILSTSPGADRLLGESAGMLTAPGERTRALVAAARTSRDRLPPDFNNHLISYRSWQAHGSGSIGILLAAPVADFLGPLGNLRTDILLTILAVVLVTIPLTILLTRKVSRMLVSLAADADRISRFDFGQAITERSLIKEFNQLAHGFGIMKETLAGRTETLDTTMEKLKTLIDLGGKLSSLRDIDQLCEEILRGAMGLTHAEGGSVYLRGTLEQKDKLEFKIVLNNKLVGFDQGGTSGKPVTLPPVPLFDASGSPNVHNAVSDAFHAAKTINIPNADTYELHDLTGTRKFDKFTGYHTVSILTVPLKPLGREVIGALQLLNARNPETGEVIPFSQEIEDLVKALAAQAATALSNQRLINDLEALFESMIKVIVEAIDAKSPYTGGHNARVPVIARMLADEAVHISEGSLAGWQAAFTNLDKQFHIAAMLHDCGKITTPEYVVDKASKLETIYNRIHEVRTRFEVLWRDAEIDCLRAQAAGTPKAEAEAVRDAAQTKLRDDFAFVADCNLGGEFLAPERLERLKEISARTWTRNFDDTLGLAWEELHRVPDSEKVPLPATERLLSDKQRHRIAREPDALKRYEELAFRVDIPELKYNLGEMYNLSVQRGTLTAEERFKINEHIMQTIVMLNNLCKNNDTLNQVVTWAGGHHETLKGTGYPYKKGGADLSVPARILAIADIFEALTAKDRPYKKAKTLSEAVKILAKFRDDGHIDPELFALFLQSGVYRRYAESYLAPEQIDDVDIVPLLAPPPATGLPMR